MVPNRATHDICKEPHEKETSYQEIYQMVEILVLKKFLNLFWEDRMASAGDSLANSFFQNKGQSNLERLKCECVNILLRLTL